MLDRFLIDDRLALREWGKRLLSTVIVPTANAATSGAVSGLVASTTNGSTGVDQDGNTTHPAMYGVDVYGDPASHYASDK